MRTKSTRILAMILIIVQLCIIILPVKTNAIIDGQFNLEYTGSHGYQIMSLNYSNASVESSFSSLADRALNLKNKSYSYSSAIQILTETKSVVSKITASDYDAYEESYKTSIDLNTSMVYQFTYESFIMRNVLYAMFRESASYTEMLKAIQIIYDTAVIQTQKDAFRSDALAVLADLYILASYTTDKNTSDMLYYVSSYASGLCGSYNGKTDIPSANISNKYNKYLQDEYDRTHGSGNIEHNTEQEDSEYSPGGYGDDQSTIEVPSITNPNIPPIDNRPSGNTDAIMDDTFASDVNDIYAGGNVGKLTLYYTLNKSNEDPVYHKTQITTKQFVSYDDIIDVIKTANRNSSLLYVEDTDAVLVVYDGLCDILEKDETLYNAETIKTLFDNFKDFGLHLGIEKETNVAQQ